MEVNALKEIANEVGKKDWDFRLNPCDSNSNWFTPQRNDTPFYNNTLTCNSATNNFDAANKIGEGGFGSVYKGTLLDGTIIAVKQLSSKSSQGNREFLNEISIISCLQHPNLVKLYGCCAEGKHLLLVYEYLENNSLAHALFGYMAPEYALWGYLTFKADVYSFGVVTLEIVVGKNNVKYRSDDENCVCLLDWALDLQKKGNLIELMDPRLGSNYDKEGALRMIKVALLCTNPSPVLRPSMSTVVKMLEGHDDILEYKSDLHEFNFQAMRDRYDEMTVRSTDLPQSSAMSTSRLIILVVIILFFNATFLEAQSGHLPPNELNALKEIADQLGKKDWDFRLNPCDNNSNWMTPKRNDTPQYNNTLTCDCSFPGGICHVQSM
nr:putative LRR receptor-like serine/threonine-protein kinase [Ipomoea batatas]